MHSPATTPTLRAGAHIAAPRRGPLLAQQRQPSAMRSTTAAAVSIADSPLAGAKYEAELQAAVDAVRLASQLCQVGVLHCWSVLQPAHGVGCCLCMRSVSAGSRVAVALGPAAAGSMLTGPAAGRPGAPPSSCQCTQHAQRSQQLNEQQQPFVEPHCLSCPSAAKSAGLLMSQPSNPCHLSLPPHPLCLLPQTVQLQLSDSEKESKTDDSPVTVADYGEDGSSNISRSLLHDHTVGRATDALVCA